MQLFAPTKQACAMRLTNGFVAIMYCTYKNLYPRMYTVYSYMDYHISPAITVRKTKSVFFSICSSEGAAIDIHFLQSNELMAIKPI